MDCFYRLSLLVVATASGCTSERAPAPMSTEPIYQVVLPADVPAQWTLHRKDGSVEVVNAREAYMSAHRHGWDSCRSEHERLQQTFSDDLDLPFPQYAGYEIRAYFDGYNQRKRASKTP